MYLVRANPENGGSSDDASSQFGCGGMFWLGVESNRTADYRTRHIFFHCKYARFELIDSKTDILAVRVGFEGSPASPTPQLTDSTLPIMPHLPRSP